MLHHRRFIGHMRIINYCCIIDTIASLVVRIISIVLVLTSQCLDILRTNISPKALLTIIARQEAIHVGGVIGVSS